MIEVRGVRFSYNRGSDPVLVDVSLTFRERTVTALLGPNGSGKTTLLNLLLGWLVPSAGRILVSGRSIGALSGRDRSRLIGHISSDETEGLELNVQEYVSLGRAPYLNLLGRIGPDDTKAVEAALDVVDFADRAAKPLRALSTGERQLASIARVLAQDPDILLLDEPTSHLDLANTRRVLGVLARLRSAGKTIVLTTHDPNTAAALADGIVLLRSGRVVADGSPGTVLTAPAIGAAYGVDVDVRIIDGRPVVLTRL